jgi:serine/threonine protein kinase
LAEAVHHAHQKGIIHRDLKPGNVMLVSGGVVSGEWSAISPLTTHHSQLTIPKITDFGLAKLLRPPTGPGQSSTRHGTLLGTPAYMPPEQLGDKRQPPGPWNDVYSLGGILFAMLTGKPPFDEGNFVATVLRVRAALEPPQVRPLRPDVPEELEQVCRKCLRKSPGERYSTALALADELKRIASTLSPEKNDSSMVKASLIPAGGGIPTVLEKSITIIGRGSNCDFRLTAPEISRRHCRIIRGPDHMVIEDLGSQHGIRINSQQTVSGLLHDGDHLEIGPCIFVVQFRALT